MRSDNNIHADITVSHDGKTFSFTCSGDGVNPDGTVEVRGSSPVRIHFKLLEGEGVRAVEFRDHKSGIWVGERDVRCPGGAPNGRESEEFDDKQPGSSRASLSIRDRKTSLGDGRYPYVLAFDADLAGGGQVSDFFDPMIFNVR